MDSEKKCKNSANTNEAGSTKKQYEPPKVKTHKVFETTSLACGKCSKGPYMQSACLVRRNKS